MSTKHKVASREVWLSERVKLLKEEKKYTQRGDELARKRQQLPWVKIDKEYRFDTDGGSVSRQTYSKDVHSFSFIISCSGRTSKRGARRVRR